MKSIQKTTQKKDESLENEERYYVKGDKKRIPILTYVMYVFAIAFAIISFGTLFAPGAEASVSGIKCYIWPTYTFMFANTVILSSDGGELFNLTGKMNRISPVSLAAFILLLVGFVSMIFLFAFLRKKKCLIIKIIPALIVLASSLCLLVVSNKELARSLEYSIMSEEEVIAYVNKYEVNKGLGYILTPIFAFLSALSWIFAVLLPIFATEDKIEKYEKSECDYVVTKSIDKEEVITLKEQEEIMGDEEIDDESSEIEDELDDVDDSDDIEESSWYTIKNKRKKGPSFLEKLSKGDSRLKNNYEELKKECLAYGLKSRISRSGDTFRLHKKAYVKITIGGKRLKVYFAVDSKDYKDTALPIRDLSEFEVHKELPSLLKVRSDLSLRRAKKLVGDVCKKDGIEKKDDALNVCK